MIFSIIFGVVIAWLIIQVLKEYPEQVVHAVRTAILFALYLLGIAVIGGLIYWFSIRS